MSILQIMVVELRNVQYVIFKLIFSSREAQGQTIGSRNEVKWAKARYGDKQGKLAKTFDRNVFDRLTSS